MQLFRRTVFLATSAVLFFCLAGLSPADDDSVERMPVHNGLQPHEGVPAPVVGDHLFASASSYETNPAENACWTADDVLQSFVLDIENVGGEITLMAEGIQQEFADSWRSAIDAGRVEVSLVIAHVIPDRRSGDRIVDVAEIGNDGCALSRTLLTADDWLSLLELARSIEV